jgi:hypothetical protein
MPWGGVRGGVKRCINQPDKTHTRGAQQEAAVQQVVEALVDGRHQHDKKQCDNLPDKRHKTGMMRDGGMARGGGTGGREVLA